MSSEETKVETVCGEPAASEEVRHDSVVEEAVITRRRFLQSAATTVVTGLAVGSGGRLIMPYAARAQGGKPTTQKLNIAYVGSGGQAGSHHHLAQEENCVAYCDVDSTRYGKLAEIAPKARAYTDWRQMYDKEFKNIDAVIVTTPDHTHGPASSHALKAGKHVYCEKPLTWAVQEARVLADLTARKKLATQMGNMGHANEGTRLVVEWIRAGAIGDVTEVHTWTNRPIWPQGDLPRKELPVPANLNWDVWIGAAEMRPYQENLHPFAWRGWFDFGCGAVGDMGCHTWDSVFWAMNPDYPSTVELLEIENKGKETFPSKSHFKWTFPAKDKRPGFEAHWYSGGLKPPIPEELLNDPTRQNLKDEKGNPKNFELAGSASLWIGTKGKMYVQGDYADSPRLIPESAHQAFGPHRPEKTIPRSPGHKPEWVMACKGEKPWNFPGSNFATYAGPLTEVMLLGAIAEKIGEVGFKIECDPTTRSIKTKRALALASRTYRRGFEL